MSRILAQKFFDRKTAEVAKELLGKFLVRQNRGKKIALMITEVEVYDGFKDKASHAHRGKTVRNAPMFGPAGHWYMYFCYGMYWMLNIVTGPKNYPAAVLIRGAVILKNASPESLREAFPRKFLPTGQAHDRELDQCEVLNGPGKLTKFLKIDKRFNGKIANKRTGLWVAAPSPKERAPFLKYLGAGRSRIRKSPRIGVKYAGPVWSKKHYRYYLEPT